MKKIGILLGIVVLIGLGFFIFRGQNSVSTLSTGDTTLSVGDGQELTDTQIQEIVSRVGKHIKLPEGTPNVGVITDIETLLSTQPFYEGAEDGDILLIYPSVSRAILFDLDEDLIINVGPVVFDNPEGGPEATE